MLTHASSTFRSLVVILVVYVRINAFDLSRTIDSVVECFKSNSIDRKQNRLLQPKISYLNGEPLVNVKDMVDLLDIIQISSLEACVRACSPTHVQDGHFYENSGYSRGNNVTYVGGYIQMLMPDFIDHIFSALSLATDYAGWRPHPLHLGIRCAEVLSYGTGGELLFHKDTDSVYTVMIVLSESDFEGGDFVIKTEAAPMGRHLDSRLVHRSSPDKADAILFDSNIEHGVETINRGIRKVLVLELWAYKDATPAHLRPTPASFSMMVPELIKMPPPYQLVKKDGIVLDVNTGLLITIGVLVGCIIGIFVSSEDSSKSKKMMKQD